MQLILLCSGSGTNATRQLVYSSSGVVAIEAAKELAKQRNEVVEQLETELAVLRQREEEQKKYLQVTLTYMA